MSEEQKRELIEHGIYIMFNGGKATTITYHLREMVQAGIKDPMMFIRGYRDAIRDEGFNESDESYISGYKYGATGIIDIKK